MTNFPLYGALDIGSNAARILFANVIQVDNQFEVFKNSLLRLPLRLGVDVYEHGSISPKKIEYLLQTLKVFQSLISIYEPLDYAVFATAAIREAENASRLIAIAKAETGFQINVIDGIEEARLIMELYASQGKEKQFKLLADLGGGSFELTIVSPDSSYRAESFKIGAVRALQKGIDKQEMSRMIHWLDKHLPVQREQVYFIGTGGNINTMKSTFSTPLRKYMELKELERLLEILEPLSVDERISGYMLRPDRADVIIPAIQIFTKLMRKTQINKVFVPGGGLSDAIILDIFKKSKSGL